ncbi:MAG: hypothetical protein FWF46_02595 [Oscillospiraceae bacterium]|nr:hypothetical protein [Oscillospiraceae bacterium]
MSVEVIEKEKGNENRNGKNKKSGFLGKAMFFTGMLAFGTMMSDADNPKLSEQGIGEVATMQKESDSYIAYLEGTLGVNEGESKKTFSDRIKNSNGDKIKTQKPKKSKRGRNELIASDENNKENSREDV